VSIERWTVTVEQRAETVSASVEFVSLQRWLRTVFTITVRQDRTACWRVCARAFA